MKNLIFVLVFLISFSELHSQSKEFTIGYTGCYPIDGDLSATSATNWSWYNELNVNLWQGWGIGEVSKHGFVFDSLYNHNLKGYFQPDTLNQHAFGKVNIHQAESNTQSSFKYNYHSNFGSDVTETFMGETVTARFFDAANYPIGEAGNPVTVLSNLNENRVQIYSGLVLDPRMQCFWDNVSGQHKNSWYVKPRMRINTSDAFGPVKNVVKIIVRAYNGEIVFETPINTHQFRYNSTLYDGRYLEDYINYVINIKADSINRGFPNVPHAWMDTSLAATDNHVDFEIQWYGEVNVWIDYVKIMDEPAYNLFSPNPFIRNRIKGQLQKMMNRQTGNTIRGFFTEEIEYSNLTCLQFLQDSILPQVISNPYIKINCLINPWSYARPASIAV